MTKKKILILVIVLSVVVVLAFLFSIIFSLININNSTIFSGVTINNVDVSGKTKEEAIKIFEDLVAKKTANDIELIYQSANDTDSDKKESSEKEASNNTISFSNLDVKYNILDAVTEAYNLGKSGNIFQNNFTILGAMLNKKNININVEFDDEFLNSTMQNISSNLPDKMIENSFYIEDNNLIITRGTAGNVADIDEFKSVLNGLLNNLSSDENMLEVPTKTSEPGEIDLEAIHNEVFKEPKDAYYEENPFKVYTEIVGIDFDVDKAKESIQNDPSQKEYKVSLIYTQPKIKLKDLNVNIFPDLLATFSTKYDASNTGRTTNLKLAASKINGLILSPGEEFSYNKVVGERSIAAGYKEAKIYSNGQVIDGLGGGICQISSTLYNGVMFANLKVTQRFNHQFTTSYVKAGRDATVVYGVKDFKFVNSRTYPIKINMSVNSGIAKVDIYGLKEETEYTVDFDVVTVSTIPTPVKYIDDSSLEEGKQKVTQAGHTGTVVNVYKVTKKNGVVVSKDFLYKDTYNALTRIINRGTKKTSSTTAEPTTPTSTEPTKPSADSKPANNSKPSSGSNNSNTSNSGNNSSESKPETTPPANNEENKPSTNNNSEQN